MHVQLSHRERTTSGHRSIFSLKDMEKVKHCGHHRHHKHQTNRIRLHKSPGRKRETRLRFSQWESSPERDVKVEPTRNAHKAIRKYPGSAAHSIKYVEYLKSKPCKIIDYRRVKVSIYISYPSSYCLLAARNGEIAKPAVPGFRPDGQMSAQLDHRPTPSRFPVHDSLPEMAFRDNIVFEGALYLTWANYYYRFRVGAKPFGGRRTRVGERRRRTGNPAPARVSHGAPPTDQWTNNPIGRRGGTRRTPSNPAWSDGWIKIITVGRYA